MLKQILKPWFIHQPGQLLRRSLLEFQSRPDCYMPLQTSWGAKIIANPCRSIGQGILTTGVHEIAVSEALARLITPGDIVVDAGANVGYMTVLAAMLAGSAGQVLAFEPHPELYDILQKNVAQVSESSQMANIQLHSIALGEQPGTAALQLPENFAANDGIAQIVPAGAVNQRSLTGSLAVAVTTLDTVLAGRMANVMKLDVEGFEPQVLAGAQRTIAQQGIRHIVFEDHDVTNSAVVQLLQQAGYQIFAIGWAMRGPTIQPLAAGSLAKDYESPNFVATLAPDEVSARWQAPGWRVLRRLKPIVTH
jgi:FkbM family methyltransferase